MMRSRYRIVETLREWGYRRIFYTAAFLGVIASVVLRSRDNYTYNGQLEDLFDRAREGVETILPSDVGSENYRLYTGYKIEGLIPIPEPKTSEPSARVLDRVLSEKLHDLGFKWIRETNGTKVDNLLVPDTYYYSCLSEIVKTQSHGHTSNVSSSGSNAKGSITAFSFRNLTKKIVSYISSHRRFSGSYHSSALDGISKDMEMILNSYSLYNYISQPNKLDPASLRAKAIRCVDLLAVNGLHKKSALLLANLYFTGTYGFERNFELAYKYYKFLAHKLGNAASHRMIGLMHAIGLGVERDYKIANLHMNLASIAGDVIALQVLAYWSYAGVGTERNLESALFYYKSIAERNMMYYLRSNDYVGSILPHQPSYAYSKFLHLYGSHPNNPKPRRNIEMANVSERILEDKDLWQACYLRAKNGDPVANLIMGFNYYNENEPETTSYSKSMKHFEEALSEYVRHMRKTNDETIDYETAKFAARNALGMIGRMYWAGEGVAKNVHTARGFFEKGAALGDGQSLNYLAIMHKYGIAGLPLNLEKASEYFEKAVLAKNVDAMYNIALLHFESGNYISAYYKFKSSYSFGHLSSGYYIAKMKEMGLGTNKDIEAAVNLYKWVVESANWHDPTIRLADKYKKANPELSFIYYLIAAESGYEIAQVNAAIKIDTREVKMSKSKSLSPSIKDEYSLAFRLLYRASVQGNPYALYKLANYLYYGIGTRDFSFDIFSKKLYYLGNSSMNNSITTPPQTPLLKNDTIPNVAESKSLLSAPANFTKKILLFLLDSVFYTFHIKHNSSSSKGEMNPQAAAVVYAESSRSCRSPISLWSLAWMYENGAGVVKDYNIAMELYKTALIISPKLYMASTISIINLSVKVFIQSKIYSLKSLLRLSKSTPSTLESTESGNEVHDASSPPTNSTHGPKINNKVSDKIMA